MKIFTDASQDDKKGIAGIGIVVCNGQKRRVISNWIKSQSINEAELQAIHTACVLAGGNRCQIVTDSQTAIQYITTGVNEKPRTQAQYIRHKRCEYWACKIRKFPNIEFAKVKAHTGNFKQIEVGNRMADVLAADGRAKFYCR